MGKDYDRYITPQNTRRLKQKKCVFLMVASVFMLTVFLIAFMCEEERVFGVLGMIWGVLQTSAQMLERRKERWTWWYIIVECAVMFCASVIGIFLSKLYWCYAFWIVLIAVCVVFAINDRCKKRK